MFSNKQFGFIEGRSTILQLLKVMDVYELNLWNQMVELMSFILILRKLLIKFPTKD